MKSVILVPLLRQPCYIKRYHENKAGGVISVNTRQKMSAVNKMEAAELDKIEL